jgi:hypothetical protein
MSSQNNPSPSKTTAVVPGHSTNLVHLQYLFLQRKFTWLLALVTGIVLAITITYACGVSSLSSPLGSSIDQTTATRNLRWLTEAAAIVLGALVASSFRTVMWAAVSTKRGITFPAWLAMDPATTHLGLLQLLKWRQADNDVSWNLHHLWALFRCASLINGSNGQVVHHRHDAPHLGFSHKFALPV